MNVVFRLAAITLAVTAALPAAAQTTELTPVVVTATRQPSRINEQLSDVTLIEREQIEQAGQSTLAELLGRQPGIEFVANGGTGTSSDVFIRGAYATQTVVLIDGMRVGSATLGTANFSRIPLSQIERVEILRGPASSLYGADAIGGVIQIFTKRGEGPASLNLSAGVGSYGTQEYSAGVRGGNDVVSYSLQAGHSEIKGFSALRNRSNAGFNPDRDGYRNDNLSASLSIRPADGHEVGLNLLYSTGRSQYDTSSGGAGLDHSLDQDQMSYTAYSRNRINDRWTSTVRLGHAIDDSTVLRGGIRNSIIRTEQDQFVWQNDIKLGFGEALFAVEQLQQNVSGTTVFPVSERTIRSYIGGWNGSVGKHRFQVSGRHDQNTQFGSRNTGSLAYGYQLTTELRGRAAFGTAFRAPTFNQLYFPNFGDATLVPEEARNREFGLIWDKAGHQVSATYYDNTVDNLIVNTGSPSRPKNIARAKLSGWTLSYGGVIMATRLDASLDLSKPVDADSGRLLPRRAEEQLKLSASRDIFGWLAGVEYQVSGRRFDDDANRLAMGGYSLTNLFAEKKLSPSLTLFTRANNIFNREYELARDYGTPGANVFVGLRYQDK